MSNSLLLSAKKGRHGCPGTMWGPASAKLHTHHHVLAAYCHYTQVASVLVMDVLFGTRWGLRAKTRWRSTCLPYWLLSQSPPQWCWESFPGAPSPVPGGCAHPCAGCLWRCPAGCAKLPSRAHSYGVEERAGAVNTPWGLHPALCHCHLSGYWGKGLASRLKTGVFLITGGRNIQSCHHLKGLSQPPDWCAAAGTIVSN